MTQVTRRDLLKGAAAVGVAGAVAPLAGPASAQTTQKKELVVAQGGDILHQAIQIFHPEWNSFACEDQENARKSRRAVLERCAGSGALLMPTHFGAPFVCRIDAKGDAFAPRWA